LAITERLKKNKNLIWDKPTAFDHNILKKAHDEDYVNMVQKSFPKEGIKFLDGDTIISPGSKDATIDAVGSVIQAIEGVEKKKFKNAFCPVRPPGHHSEKDKAMGFCIYNNCAVGAHYLIEKFKYNRIAIWDPDVHQGNGHQDIFWDNENVLYLSTHQYPFYPGTGSEKEKGNHNNIFNVPLPAGTTSEEYLNAHNRVLDRLIEFKPEFLLISMGFDMHIDDPLAQFKLSSKDFNEITKRTLMATQK
jgi:Deacetylases, including yeast histone deacetylase and acetoin utilization protein